MTASGDNLAPQEKLKKTDGKAVPPQRGALSFSRAGVHADKKKKKKTVAKKKNMSIIGVDE